MEHAHKFQRFWNDLNELAKLGHGTHLKTHAHVDKSDKNDTPWVGYALFSMDDRYRYALMRVWDRDKPIFATVMLNPSTANEHTLDPTVERIRVRAEQGGFGSFLVLNIFAYRATDPDALRVQKDPVGRVNDLVLDTLLPHGSVVMCGWGTHGDYRDRGRYVEQRIRKAGILPVVLKLTKDGHPGHPLYIGYGVRLKPWKDVVPDED